MTPIEMPTHPRDMAAGRVSEYSITATANADLPAWYRTDTPHIQHPHAARTGRCLPGTTRHRDVRPRRDA